MGQQPRLVDKSAVQYTLRATIVTQRLQVGLVYVAPSALGAAGGTHARANQKAGLLAVSKYGFFCRDFCAFFPEVETKPAEDSHVNVCHPDQRKTGNQIPSPIGKQKLVASDDQEEGSNVVAEAVFASEQVEKFAFEDETAGLAVRDAEFMEFAYDFFMRDGPRNGCNGESDDKQR